MARYSPQTATTPTRKYADSAIGYLPAKARAPRTFTPAIDDPLLALQVELTGKPAKLTSRGKPVGGIGVFGERRAPARRAAYRTPPR